MVIDDGRRFLRRSETKFDLITINPPPQVEAAGSSLLYSREFYIRFSFSFAIRHLGIVVATFEIRVAVRATGALQIILDFAQLAPCPAK